VKQIGWIVATIAFAGWVPALLAQESYGADEGHDPADPLLPELLAWDQFRAAQFQLTGSANCELRIARLQWRNFRLHYQRHFQVREQRIYARVRELFGETVISHTHDILAVTRCSRTARGAYPGSINEYRRALIANEQRFGISSRTSERP
jgi:hypothetical protein